MPPKEPNKPAPAKTALAQLATARDLYAAIAACNPRFREAPRSGQRLRDRRGEADALITLRAGKRAMRSAITAGLAALVLSLVLIAPVAAGPYEDAYAALGRADYATAIPIYRSLAERGNAAAMKQLGFFYESGLGVKRDWLEAAKWYSKALEAGNQDAGMSLGWIGRQWRVMTHTDMNPIVYELIEKAATKGNITAQFSLGVMNYPYSDSEFGEDKGNLQEALIWYRSAAEQGDFDSEVALAYEHGMGVPQDYVEAHKWYNLAAPRPQYADLRTEIIKRRDALALKMTPPQIAEAQKLAREWKPKSN